MSFALELFYAILSIAAFAFSLASHTPQLIIGFLAITMALSLVSVGTSVAEAALAPPIIFTPQGQQGDQ